MWSRVDLQCTEQALEGQFLRNSCIPKITVYLKILALPACKEANRHILQAFIEHNTFYVAGSSSQKFSSSVSRSIFCIKRQ